LPRLSRCYSNVVSNCWEGVETGPKFGPQQRGEIIYEEQMLGSQSRMECLVWRKIR